MMSLYVKNYIGHYILLITFIKYTVSNVVQDFIVYQQCINRSGFRIIFVSSPFSVNVSTLIAAVM